MERHRDSAVWVQVLFYFRVPTFDSNDREWDSYAIVYLVWLENRLCGISERGGYQLAKVTLYTDMCIGDTTAAKLMEVMGMTGK